MKKSDARIRNYFTAGGSIPTASPQDGRSLRMQEAIRLSKAAYYETEALGQLSGAEFVYQQGRYIRKRWWVLQGSLLLALWFLLVISESSVGTRKCMGAAAPLFAVLLLPELWKNQNADATEIEGAAFYSLRQVYAARIFLFAMVDFLLLGAFSAAALLSGLVCPEELLAQFFLPCSVTCCICFCTLYSRKMGSEAFALLACGAWYILWNLAVLDEKIYGAISPSACLAVTIAAVFYTGYCIFRGQGQLPYRIWEENRYGTETD